MAKNTLRYDLEVGTKQAQRDLKAASKEAAKLGDELDDNVSAGKRFAKAMNTVTDGVERDFKEAKKAADALEKEMDSGLIQSFKDAGRSLDDLVDDLKRAGLTYDEIAADADALADAMKRANDVGDQMDAHITKNLDGVAREADRSGSVMANAMGNMAQEIPGVSGAFGPLNTAIGQFAEYAAEGGISMGGLIAAAGPIAVVGLAIAGVTSVMSDNAKRAQFLEDQVADLTAAFRDARENGTTAAEAIAKKWESNGGKIEVEISNATATVVEFGEATDDMGKIHDLVYPTAQRHVEDFGDELVALNMDAVKFAELGLKTTDEIKAWGEAMVNAGFDAATVNKVMQGAVGLQAAVAEGAKSDAIWVSLFGDESKDAANQLSDLNDEVTNVSDSFGVLLDTLSAEDAFDSTAEGFENIQKAGEDALNAVTEGAEDAAAKQRNFDQAVRDQKRSVIELADELGKVPKSVVSDVVAMIDRGEFDKAKTEIERWKNTPVYKKVVIDVSGITAGAGVGQSVRVGLVGGGSVKSAAGRRDFSGVTRVAEQGAEMVTLPDGSTFLAGNDMQIDSAQKTRSGRGGTPTIVNDNRTFNILVPNQSPEDTAASIARYNRRNGIS